MRSIDETMQFLKTASKVVDLRLSTLQETGADRKRIERERWRQRIIEDTLKAVEEASVSVN